MVARLAQMSPEERTAALARLPPLRQQQLAQKLNEFAALPPEQQARYLGQTARIMSLSPERQAEVHLSLTDYQNTPGPRKAVLANEMTRLSTMTDEQRANYMAKPNFRQRFSVPEIEMMNNLRGIVP
jgi:hypothetical protein